MVCFYFYDYNKSVGQIVFFKKSLAPSGRQQRCFGQNWVARHEVQPARGSRAMVNVEPCTY